MSYELYLEPPRPQRNRKTGHFLKGHTPANKGKSWGEYMPKRSQRRCAKGWKNVEKFRPKQRPDNAGRCRKKCVVLTDEGKFKIFDYIGQAGEWVGGSRENVRRCCALNASDHVCQKGLHKGAQNTDHKYKGYRFYYYDDPVWWTKTAYG